MELRKTVILLQRHLLTHYQVLTVIRFLCAGSSAVEIHRELYPVYELSVMSYAMCMTKTAIWSSIDDYWAGSRIFWCLRTTVYKIVTENVGYHKFCESKNAHQPAQETKWMNVLAPLSTSFVNNWFNSQLGKFYTDQLKKLVPRYEECLKVNGDYVEQLSKFAGD